jgi:hypothetical protein
MERRDSVDDHLDRWVPLPPELDPVIEGVVRGFVRRRPSSADRRRVDVGFTAEGCNAWRAAMAVAGREEERILRTLSAAGSR